MGKEKKEIWKLIELFKDYIENYGNDAKVREEENYILDTWIEFVYWSRVYLYETIISKKFWFIKWLVENDKIDRDKVNEKSEYKIYYSGTPREVKQTSIDGLLMLLSISDTPIDLLCSLLK